ncbi:MAG: heat shock protein HtpX [Oceanicoccus sp.]
MKHESRHAATSQYLINTLESMAIILFLAAIPAALGHIIIGENGLLAGFTISLVIFAALPRLPPSTIMKSYGAQRISPRQNYELNFRLSQLAERAGLASSPALYLLPSNQLHAFTFGNERDSAIAVSQGLLRFLNSGELIGVLAHEIGHIKSHDTHLMMTANIAQLVTEQLSFLGKILFILWIPIFLSEGNMAFGIPLFFFIILSPVITALLRSFLSRTREFNADIFSAELTKNPLQLASALQKMDDLQHGIFSNVFRLQRQPTVGWLSTHPETGLRIDRLMALSKEWYGR